MHRLIFALLLCAICASSWAESKRVVGVIISSIEQRSDDEEAPFEIRARNKIHKCGGSPSNLFRVYSEYETVAMRRFLLAMEAMKLNWTISVNTDGCEDKALLVNSIRLDR
jgi:hypothetical protein